MTAASTGTTRGEQTNDDQPSILDGLQWRCIGPHRGGRVVAVAGHPADPLAFYFGACAGGVWRSTDGGQYWENCSDGYFNTAAVGAIAVADADPNVIYAGTGETCIRGNVSHGDGVYKSTDGGQSWTNLGLADTRHIARIRVHPRNPDLVYVAALGHAWGPNQERGVYRSKDGGQTWEQVLFRSDKAGAIDLSMDPSNPRILYAALWEAQRGPWYLNSGGPGSGLFKSTDGGDTWTEITRNPGLPTGVIGRIGVAVSPARTGRVWALVEAEDGALFRSDDGGATWQRTSDKEDLRRRFWYYGHLFADPRDPDTCWVLNLQCWKSTDGGATFVAVPTPHGDNHDLWLDPKNPQRMIEGNDGGACVTFNGGASWSSIYNQPTAQFYHVVADSQFPYRVYGSQQDNSALTLPSRSPEGAITEQDWYVPGGGESGYIAVRPDEPNVVFGGSIGSGPGDGLFYRYDRRTRQARAITVWPEAKGMGEGAGALKYRFQWTFPIELSPHDPNVLYACSNHVHRSTDEGHSWEELSPDLTRNDPEKLGPSGGPITRDNTGAEHYCTIFAFRESPHERGVFWVGSDDGLVHLSRDGGQTWQEITPPTDLLPEWALISIIELSPHDPATAYVAATRYKLDDRRPYLLKTNDYGQTWQPITSGIPEDDFTRVVREDPERRGLLYAGTETGLYVSVDDGASWRRLGGNLPVVPIHDLIVKDGDLVLATHGRSFWILDDLTLLRELAANGGDSQDQGVRLFAPRPTYRFVSSGWEGFPGTPGYFNYLSAGGVVTTYRETKEPTGETKRHYLDAGENPPSGAMIFYTLREQPRGEVKLIILDAAGEEVKSFSSKEPEKDAKQDDGATTETRVALGSPEGAEAEEPPRETARDDGESKEPKVPVEPGLNRFVWNLRYADPRKLRKTGEANLMMEDFLAGPLAPPGRYQVRLAIDGREYTESFELLKDPTVPATQQELEEQFEVLLGIRDRMSEINDTVNQLRDIRQQVEEWERRVKGRAVAGDVATSGKGLRDALTAVEEELLQVKAESALSYPAKLKEKLVTLGMIVASADAPPTKSSREVYASLGERIDQQLARFKEIVDTDVAAFNQLLRGADLPPVLPMPPDAR